MKFMIFLTKAVTHKRKGVIIIIIGVVLGSVFFTHWYKSSRSMIRSINEAQKKCVAIFEPLRDQCLIEDKEYKYLQNHLALNSMFVRMFMNSILINGLLLCFILIGYGCILWRYFDRGRSKICTTPTTGCDEDGNE